MKKQEVISIYSAGLLQGIALVAFPAASVVLTDPQAFDLSPAAYGALFVPQALLSIGASLFSSACRHLRSLYLFGLLANLLAMVLLATSALFIHHLLAYPLLLMATSCLGIGFGLTVPSLNTYASLFFPNKKDTAILLLNALLGLGTTLAPVFIIVFVKLGFWWGLPLLMALSFVVLGLCSLKLSLHETSSSKRQTIPRGFWLFALCALLYGTIETINGNWVETYMSTVAKAPAMMASLALALFWAMITLGRIGFSQVKKIRLVYALLPFVIALSFLIHFTTPWGSVFKFALAGIGCSALLPLTISLAQHDLKAPSIAGGILAFYLLGYGIASFGIGALQGVLGLSLLFQLSSLLALILGTISLLVFYRKYLD